MVDRYDLALARARVLLSDIAPEIPETEIVPQARLAEDLGLDLVSIWALAVGLEKLAKVEILDADIRAAITLEDLLSHALTDVPADYADAAALGLADDESAAGVSDGTTAAKAATPASARQEEKEPDDGPSGADDLEAAMQDLANLFNN